MSRRSSLDTIPDVRDGLTRAERVVLYTLAELQVERRGRNVPTAMLYGRVVERMDMSVDELQRILQRLGAARGYGG
ncbi:hypothetical protein [Chondromyces crocatus]|uniref:Uncharacterized protein n=1 Tax=Chondromyces crocatus TaxID=52 RepID=A0A0K1EBG5_CHOCO|nr:hypothetical protein [Chondromyces crocatus]AKT37923.1 uncharacterized protein CMC5_020660 [Chondromyces crocatus]